MTEPMILRFGRGGPGKLTLRSDPDLADVCRAEFVGKEPGYEVDDRTIEIIYNSTCWFWGSSGESEAAITLSEKTPWRVEVQGGIGKGEFDLRRIDVDEIRVDGGIGKIELALGRPRGTVNIVMRGGLAKGLVVRPADVPVFLKIGGGAGLVVVDGQKFAGVGGGSEWATLGYDEAADRYEITVQGGCAKFIVEEESND